jgi:hypothetical protein
VAGSIQSQNLPLAKYLRPGAVAALSPIPVPATTDAGVAGPPTGGGGSGGGGGAGGSSSGGATTGGGSMSIQCGATMCPMPSVCCEPMPDAGGAKTSSCLVACDYNTQVQLCGNSNDCQAGPPNCVNGICVN